MAKKQPQKKTAEKYGVSVRTIERWREDPKMGFPPGEVINGRIYDDADQLDAWDRSRILAAKQGTDVKCEETEDA